MDAPPATGDAGDVAEFSAVYQDCAGDAGDVADGRATDPRSQGRVPLEVDGVITSGQLEVGVQLEDLEADLEAVPITTESRSK